MKLWKLAFSTAALVLSSSVNAAVITHGNLVTDDTTNFITDITTDRMYLRFNAFDLTYADTITAISAGGQFEGWSIATGHVVDDFLNAALGVSSTACDGPASYGTSCGTITGWTSGNFGDTYNSGLDYFAFLTSPGSARQTGLVLIEPSGKINEYYNWGALTGPDTWNGINYLLYRNVSVVPVPAAIWLFGSGVVGLAGFARRKKA